MALLNKFGLFWSSRNHCLAMIIICTEVQARTVFLTQDSIGGQFLAPYTAPGIVLFAFKAASSSVGRPVPVTSLPTVTQ